MSLCFGLGEDGDRMGVFVGFREVLWGSEVGVWVCV